MMPRPPARETAEASWVRAIQPIGACTMGYLAPVWARTRFMAVRCGEGEEGCEIPGDDMLPKSARQPCFTGCFPRLPWLSPPRSLGQSSPGTAVLEHRNQEQKSPERNVWHA